MKKINRVKDSNDFALAIKKGKAYNNPSYTVHIVKNEINIIRIGISVSKKLGKAVIRNRIRRQIRSMCDSLLDYDLPKSYDVIVIARAPYLSKNYNENLSLLNDILIKEIGLNS